MKRYLLFLLIPLFLLSCQKELTPDDLTSGGNGGTPGTACDSYFPLTAGNTWTYDQDGATLTNTVTIPDSVIQGKSFKRITQGVSGNVISSFFREENGNIFEFIDLNNNSAASGKVLLNVLRSNAAVGEQWRDTVIVNGIPEKFEFTMVEKNMNYQVGTLNFTNVHHIKYEVKIDFPPIFNDETIQITDAWFAKCVGPVNTESLFSFSGINTTSSVRIKSYSIK